MVACGSQASEGAPVAATESAWCEDDCTQGESTGSDDGDPIVSTSDDSGPPDTGEEPAGTSSTTGADDGDPGDSTGESVAVEVCYPGADRSGTTCFDLVEIDPYDYPEDGDPDYERPIRFLDLQTVDLETMVAPNFALIELCDPANGRYQVLQRHAVERLQAVRDRLGPLGVDAGFRAPVANTPEMGGDPPSRHMYGDAFDLYNGALPPEEIVFACQAEGADEVFIAQSGDVHCDWRHGPHDALFFE